MPRKVLIAGCGYVGGATAELFRASGDEVECWTSTTDISSWDAVEQAANGRTFDVVVQSVSSRGGGAEAYRRVYLEGARNLTRTFPEALLIFTSSTSVYPQRDGEWVDESSEAEPERETGRILRETEELVLARGGAVARLAGICGPGRSALLRKFLAGEAVLDPSGPRWVNQIHRDDAAAALHHLSKLQFATERRIFNITDGQPWTDGDCYAWLAGHFKRHLPPVSTTPIERKRGNSNKRVSSTRLRDAGWSPRYPNFEVAMRDSILPHLEQLGA
jgi:nucleoside-diphosphate-sugar epimerase